jgi:surface polysaccharide O-acyltransferase-like enzyme
MGGQDEVYTIASKESGLAGQSKPIAAPMAPSRHLDGADLLRCAAVLMVIVIHTSTWQGKQDIFKATLVPDLAAIGRFSVPAFVLLSGLLIAYRTAPTNRAWLGRRLRRSLLPYAVWAPALMLFGLFVSHAVARHPADIFSWFIGGGGHLYYLLLAAQLSVLGMIRLPSGNRLFWVAVVAVIVQLGLDIWRLYLPLPGGWLGGFMMNHSFEVIIYWLGYAAIGAVLGARMRRGKALPPIRVLLPFTIVFGAAFVLFGATGSPRPAYATGTGAYLAPLLFPLTVSICMLLLASGRVLRTGSLTTRFVKMTSRHSLGIYLIHPAFLVLIGTHLYKWLGGRHDALALGAFALMYSGAFLGGLVITRLLAATKLAVLVGESRQPLRLAEQLASVAGAGKQRVRSPAA